MTSLKDIRNAIDKIDSQIIALIADRRSLVLSAAPFKDSPVGETGVRVPERISSMLLSIRLQAEEKGLDPVFMEKLFSDLIEHSIGLEHEEWLSLAENK
jgi:chorismate mutase-like protein